MGGGTIEKHETERFVRVERPSAIESHSKLELAQSEQKQAEIQEPKEIIQLFLLHLRGEIVRGR